MRKTLLFTLITAFSACNAPTEKAKNVVANAMESKTEAAKIFENYYNERMKLFPLEATQNGVNDYNDLMPVDISDSFRDSTARFYQKYQTELAKLDNSKLSETDKMSFNILNYDLATALEGLKFRENLIPLNQFYGRHLDMGQMGSGEGSQPFKTTKDYDNWLNRIGQFPAWVDTAIVNMRVGLKKGYVLPKALTVKILPQLKSIVETETGKNLFFQPILKLATNAEINSADKVRLTAEYTNMVTTVVKPTYKKLYEFMEKEYLPKTRASSGISDVPMGKEYYAYLAKSSTTTDMTPDQIFELGEKEVARIRAEMEAVKTQVGFKGDLKAFFKHVNDVEPKLRPFKDPKEVVVHFNQIHDKMKASLQKQFDLTPKTPFEVRRTEAFREATASAEYNPGSLANGRSGIFYVPIPDVLKYNTFQDEALFLHEAIPGHHYQISLQQENKDLPMFRRNLWYNAYGEGWALYTEGLGKELGLYDDPYSYFGRLGNEMHRAIRLVVDVGLHTKGWSREKAIRYDLDNEADSEEGITAEIERYMAIPGQAVSYKIGEQKILALKKMAKDKLGDKFNIQKFHNEVLNDGCVPLSILEQKVQKFIEKSSLKG